jgi:tetratricopeptide (TPR) repeat protein
MEELKLSETPLYLKYVDARSKGDFAAARSYLEHLLVEHADDLPTHQRVFILQCVGQCYFDGGDEEGALDYFRQAESVDKTSILARLHFAEFLGRRLQRRQQAIEKCDEAIRMAEEQQLPPSDNDYSSDEYRDRALALKAEFDPASNR